MANKTFSLISNQVVTGATRFFGQSNSVLNKYAMSTADQQFAYYEKLLATLAEETTPEVTQYAIIKDKDSDTLKKVLISKLIAFTTQKHGYVWISSLDTTADFPSLATAIAAGYSNIIIKDVYSNTDYIRNCNFLIMENATLQGKFEQCNFKGTDRTLCKVKTTNITTDCTFENIDVKPLSIANGKFNGCYFKRCVVEFQAIINDITTFPTIIDNCIVTSLNNAGTISEVGTVHFINNCFLNTNIALFSSEAYPSSIDHCKCNGDIYTFTGSYFHLLGSTFGDCYVNLGTSHIGLDNSFIFFNTAFPNGFDETYAGSNCLIDHNLV